ncbi:ABC transporter ATP-binding protein [Mycobacteroides abscessus subsp. bolletii]|nr:ABC transporter ATP-binding protein [Mycobacteroides abscessus subsp. bolletii]SHW21128.1 ABC transporter ATP-binding protein [Mycobacteroides abscessus subsp. bolletii]SHW70400.1 ABC transporter ATP-binding protein [Mycobacteroides abscessus subsp. bolletii]SKR95215.1 ABC transporter ATP-binding protein [Mycobacteroides abscessus subsp. bolletii]SKS01807.1 ABC transporter ATP-binding protein [Mycobacteroides abscessus subsp. bolletii]
MAALTAAMVIVGIALPILGAVQLLGAVPMGLLGYRYRIRVLLAAAVAGGVIAFLLAGLGGFIAMCQCVYIGGLTGVVRRRGHGMPLLTVIGVICSAIIAALAVGALTLLNRMRTLLFDALRASLEGLFKMIGHIPHLEAVGVNATSAIDYAMRNWMWFIGGIVFTFVLLNTMFGWWVLSRVIRRLSVIPDVHQLDPPAVAGAVGPVPARLHEVRFRYPRGESDALAPLSMNIDVGEHVAITGPNGSGKSTLMRILAGREPTSGQIERPGSVGLGAIGGTAIVMQHPESQVLGTKVADDVVWGLPADHKVDIDGLLREVGLEGMAEHSTSSLSGGELQRLAVASALARDPALLVADEITSMVDPQGRQDLLGVLSRLTQQHRMSLVHITHFQSEAEAADREVALRAVNGKAARTAIQTVPVPATSAARPDNESPVVLEFDSVGHEYASGTPWAKTALRDVSLAVHEGDGVLIHGGNGSGKSTFAWIAAGLTKPTTGQCLLDGRPVSDQVGSVAISFQAARLQLLRSRVDYEIASAAGFSARDTDRVVRALASVGLEPDLATRPIDQLSGGQMRRVVLAGLLARSPRALILDEPLAGLDAEAQAGLLRLLVEVRERERLTIVVISHDFDGMQELCPRTVHLQSGVLLPEAVGSGRR